MIPVRRRPEYSEFDDEVRQPGLQFLKAKRHPNSREFDEHEYWRRARPHLVRAYAGFCAYTSLYIVGPDESVDHFYPKSKYPCLAYEWSNYRLARRKVNSHKGDTIGIVDPFKVKKSWFILDFPSCLVRSGDGLNKEEKKSVEKSIEVLRLNDDDGLVQERCNFVRRLVSGKITPECLRRYYPFLSVEIERQGLDVQTLRAMFKPLP